MRMLPRSRTSALRAATRANAAAKAAAKEAQKEKGQRCVCSSSRILLLFLLEHSHRGVGETGRRGVPFSSSASTSSSSSSSSSSSFPKKTTLKKRTKKNFGEYYYRRRRRHHHCGNTTTTTNRATAESAAVFALERRLFFTRATPPLSTPGWWSPTLRFAGKNDDDDDDGFDGRIDAKDDEYDADARDDDDDDDDFNNNNNNNDDGGENTDPIVDESFTTADFGYKRHYQGTTLRFYDFLIMLKLTSDATTPLLLFVSLRRNNSWSRYTEHGRTVSGFRDDHNLRGHVVVRQRHISIGCDDGRVQRRRDVWESERDFDRPRWTHVSV